MNLQFAVIRFAAKVYCGSGGSKRGRAMKKTLTVLVVVVCVLGVTEVGKDKAHGLAASELATFTDFYCVGNLGLGLDLASTGTSGEASLPGKVARVHKLPEPATMMLFGLGLLGLASFRKRFK